MGADYSLVFYGIRERTTPDEMERLAWDETATPPEGMERLRWDDTSFRLKGERTGLEYFYDGYDLPAMGEAYLFVGREIGVFGGEYDAGKSVSESELMELMADTNSKLKTLGIDDEPAIYVHWFPDR